MKNSKKYIGSVYRTNEGYQLTVIGGGSKGGYATVQIRNYIFEAQISSIKRGEVKYPFHPSVFGVGCFGIGEYSAKTDKLAYQKWKGMLQRCYDQEFQKKHPTYIGCSVDSRWHNFQAFAKWFYKYYPTNGNRYELDKDIRFKDNKIYSSYTCMFILARLNLFMTNIKADNTSGYTGVSWSKPMNKWMAGINIDGKTKNLGRFTDIEDASEAYAKARAIEAKRLRDYYSFDYPKEILDNIQ